MDFYIARDEDGALYLYFAKPIRFDDYFDVVCTHEPVYLDNTTFPDIGTLPLIVNKSSPLPHFSPLQRKTAGNSS